MELLIAAFIFFISGTIAFLSPTLFACLVIVVYTGFLGLIERETLGPFTTENLLALISISSAPTLIYKRRIKSTPLQRIELFPIVMLSALAWGIYITVHREQSSLPLALTEGKQFLTYLFVWYCITLSKKIKIKVIKYAIVTASIYLSTTQLLFHFFGIHPPGYSLVDPNEASHAKNNIHIMYPHIMAIGLILLTSDRLFLRNLPLILTASPIISSGILTQAHSSVLIVTLIIIFTQTIKINITPQTIRRTLIAILLMSIILAGLVNFSGDLIDLMIGYESDLTQALASRGVISVQRIAYFLDSPFIGYGFVHEDSALGVVFGSAAIGLHDLRLATVDNGYLDLLVRFGAIGSGIIIISFFIFCKSLAENSATQTYPIVLFAIFYLGIMTTWSLLTYVHGIIILGFITLLVQPKPNPSLIKNRNPHQSVCKTPHKPAIHI